MRKKLKRRLPLHHIDTSIILESPKTENGIYCKKYLNLVGYKYRGVFSLPVLGELLFAILKLKEINKRYDLLDLIYTLIIERRIEFRFVRGTGSVIRRIKDVDPLITSTDRLILACAVSHKADVLVTLDTRLINNKVLEKEFKIKIKHPKDLL